MRPEHSWPSLRRKNQFCQRVTTVDEQPPARPERSANAADGSIEAVGMSAVESTNPDGECEVVPLLVGFEDEVLGRAGLDTQTTRPNEILGSCDELCDGS